LWNPQAQKQVLKDLSKQELAQKWAIEDATHQESTSAAVEGVPQEYQWHAHVFSEEVSKRLPPSWGCHDMSIDLKPGAPYRINCKVYPLTEQGKITTLQFLKKHEDKGYIEKTSSRYSSPWFLIPKRIELYDLSKIIEK
jgi:hypothetical protein